MSAFVPSATSFGARPATMLQNRGNSVCQRVMAPVSTFAPMRATNPFFGSAAFGAPLPSPPVRAANPNEAPRMNVTVVVGDSEPVESALRRFKRDVARSGHLMELRRRRYFETSTERRLRKAVASRRKARLARIANKTAKRNMQK